MTRFTMQLICHTLRPPFLPRVIDQTAGMHGDKLLAMTQKDLIEVFGKQEGKRLFSQLTISKNSTNYKTVVLHTGQTSVLY